MVPYVTNRLVTVRKGVIQGIWATVATNVVHLGILEWIAKNVVVDTVSTANHVTISMECVLMVARMDIVEHTVTDLVMQDTTAQTVLIVVLITAKDVNTQMDCVPVMQVGWVPIALQNALNPMGKIANSSAVYSVLTKLVTDSTGDV